MIVMGWDPGTTHLGYAVVESSPARCRVLAHGNVGSPKLKSDKTSAARLDRVAAVIAEHVQRYAPEALGYEWQAGVHVGKDREGQESSWALREVHEVTGMLRLAARCALDAPIPCYSPAPRSIKVALLGKGNGSASKAAIKRAVEMMFGVRSCSSHAADAIATAVATLRQHRLALRAGL